jgi:hypothetical protein
VKRLLVPVIVLALLAAPPLADAQPGGKVHRIGILFEGTPLADMVGPEPRSPILRVFLEGLRELDIWKATMSSSNDVPPVANPSAFRRSRQSSCDSTRM